MSTTLRQLQCAMQRTIMSNFDELAASGKAGGCSIYARAYRLRLRDALAHNYALLQTHLGTETFATLAEAYLDAQPSTHVSVRAFGAQLPQWLNSHRAQESWLAEFAEFEWALAGAFDAVDEPWVTIEALAHIDPNQWAQLTFRFARHVERLTFRTNAAAMYANAAREAPVASAAVGTAPREWLIWRKALAAQYRSMTELEACALDALRTGQTFSEACELMFEIGTGTAVPMQAAAFLKRWVTDELICAVAVAA
jgi:hypothetical protein